MNIEGTWKKKLAFWRIPFIILNVVALLFIEGHTHLYKAVYGQGS